MKTYYYRVDEYVNVFGRGDGQDQSFSHSLDFTFDTLSESRHQAYDYYHDRLQILSKEEGYFLPFVPIKDTHLGLVAVYSLTLYLVECYNEDEYYLHALEGIPEEESIASRKIEEELLGDGEALTFQNIG
jgi:hypothetical protein